MATIQIRKGFQGGKVVARAKVGAILKEFQTDLGIEGSWSGDEFRFKARQGVSGRVVLSEHDVLIEMDLPFLLRLFKGTVESKIRERLEGF